MATPNYEIDYNDKRFTDVKTEETNAVNKNNTFYNDAVNKIDNQINTQIGNVKDWGAEQAKNQQAQHDFTIQQIEQKKEQAQQDYKKEQSAAYVDWQKQSNQYGANAEQMAAQGMSNTGYSESSQVAMYNQYQNRVAVAREAISRAELEFDNQMTQARLQNSSILAEIAYNTLKEIDSLTLAGIQKTSALRSEQVKRETEIKQIYHNQWQDLLKQINTENSLKESVRQHENEMSYKNAQLELQKTQEENLKTYRQAQLDEQKRQFDILHPAGGGEAFTTKTGGSSGGRKYTGNTKVTKPSGKKVGSGKSTVNNSNHKTLESSNWKRVGAGGINWFGGVDGNAKYKNTSTGKTYTGDQLVKALQKEGMSKSQAKDYVKALQKGAEA